MLQNDKPRHNVRAQGKVRAAAPPDDSRTSKSPDANVRMLNYLSLNASESEKYLLEQGANASVRSSSAAALMLETWLNSSTALGEGADPLDETAFEGYWPKASFEDDLTSGADSYYSGGSSASSTAGFAADLSSISNGNSSGSEHQRPASSMRSVGGGPEAYLRSLRQRAKPGESNPARRRDSAKSNAKGDSTGPLVAGRGDYAVSGPVAVRFKPRVTVEIAANGRGERIETYPNGARVIKDSVGRVHEIVSEKGISVLLSYDDKGHLSSFTRSDKRGTVHSRAEADKHGVLVRDSRGRVRAQGESMQVDACGCVSISREDGQFWSIDLIRSIHTERRLLPDEHGDWYSMTALFCSDGFRMATRFRKVSVRDDEYGVALGTSDPSKAFVTGEDSGSYRFYGRDGSMITFDSDAELHYLKPSNVRGPGSRVVPAEQKGKRQAGTAWESLREYVFNYLAAL